MGPCLCGDTECPSCGPLQGTSKEDPEEQEYDNMKEVDDDYDQEHYTGPRGREAADELSYTMDQARRLK